MLCSAHSRGRREPGLLRGCVASAAFGCLPFLLLPPLAVRPVCAPVCVAAGDAAVPHGPAAAAALQGDGAALCGAHVQGSGPRWHCRSWIAGVLIQPFQLGPAGEPAAQEAAAAGPAQTLAAGAAEEAAAAPAAMPSTAQRHWRRRPRTRFGAAGGWRRRVNRLNSDAAGGRRCAGSTADLSNVLSIYTLDAGTMLTAQLAVCWVAGNGAGSLARAASGWNGKRDEGRLAAMASERKLNLESFLNPVSKYMNQEYC